MESGGNSDVWPLDIHISLAILFTGKAFCERAAEVRTRKMTTWDRILFVARWKDNRGVMRTVIDIRLVSCYITREAGRIKKLSGKEWCKNGAGKYRPCAWSDLFPFASCLWYQLKATKQSNRTLHAVLNKWFAEMTVLEDVAVQLPDKSWWNMSSCYIPRVQTRRGCKGGMCAV